MKYALKVAMVCLLIGMPFFVSAQVKYGPGVHEKINSNTARGIDKYSGIQKMYVLHVDGCGSAAKAEILAKTLMDKVKITRWEFIEPGYIRIYCDYRTEKHFFKEALDPLYLVIWSMEESYVLI
jgi:hypothetical protein